jgi:hypothetical protein
MFVDFHTRLHSNTPKQLITRTSSGRKSRQRRCRSTEYFYKCARSKCTIFLFLGALCIRCVVFVAHTPTCTLAYIYHLCTSTYIYQTCTLLHVYYTCTLTYITCKLTCIYIYIYIYIYICMAIVHTMGLFLGALYVK